MMLSYRQRQLVNAFVFLAKCGRGGAKLSELAAALGLAQNSASVREIVDRLVFLRVIAKVRMESEPRKPWRLYAHIVAQKYAGSLSFEQWRARNE